MRRGGWWIWIWLALTRRWRSNLLSVASIVVGIAASTAILGTAQTSANSVAKRFQRLESNQIVVSMDASLSSDADVERRVHDLADVREVGRFSIVTSGPLQSLQLRDYWTGENSGETRVAIADSPGLLAHGITVRRGTVPGELAWRMDPSLAVVGSASAVDLGITSVPARVSVGSLVLTVTAIVTDAGEALDLAQTLVISPEIAEAVGFAPSERQFVVLVKAGRARNVAAALPFVIAPLRPEAAGVSLPVTPALLRADISATVKSLVLVITLATLVASLVGVAGTLLASVATRRSEIGIQRAMGASRLWIARQFLGEAACVGTFGGILGWSLGIIIAWGVAVQSASEFVLPPMVWALPLAGVVAGLVGGVAPAVRAVRLDPSSLLGG